VLYRRHVYDYGNICRPIREAIRAATSKNQKEIAGAFVWTEECLQAVVKLQQVLASKPLHRLPDPSRPYYLFTDASGYAFGCVLCQRDDSGDFYSVLYDSVAFPGKTRAWHTTEKETYAVVHYIHKYSHYLDNGLDFTIFTDHSAVNSALSSPKANGKLLRWGLSLLPFVGRMFVRHWPGKEMPADFMSRHPMWLKDANVEQPGELFRLAFLPVSEGSTEDNAFVAALTSAVVDDVDDFVFSVGSAIAALQRECEEVGVLYAGASGDLDAQRSAAAMWNAATFMIDADGVLWRVTPGRSPEQVAPIGLRRLLLTSLHDAPLAGHAKGDRLLQRLVGKFWWPDCVREAHEWHRSCEACQLHARPRHAPYGELRSAAALELFSMTAMDLVGPLPLSSGGNRYLLVWTDYLTRWAEAVPIPDKSAATVARGFVSSILCRWGAPLRVLTDCGKEFSNQVFDYVARLVGTDHALTAPYHPQADGMVERLNGTLVAKLARYLRFDQSDWDLYVPFAVFAFNSERHSVTQLSPFRAMTGLEPRMPIDTTLLQRGTKGSNADLDRLRAAARQWAADKDVARRNASADANTSRLASPFAVGDLVVRRVHALPRPSVKGDKSAAVSRSLSKSARSLKLARRFSSPMRVVRRDGERFTLAACNRPDKEVVAHSSDLEFFRLPELTR
jgi:hypothetical protein